MKLRKTVCALVCASLLAASAAIGAGAEKMNTAAPAAASHSDSGISPQAEDVIEIRYRMEPYTKKWQYRRWNVTKNRWQDSVWIYVT